MAQKLSFDVAAQERHAGAQHDLHFRPCLQHGFELLDTGQRCCQVGVPVSQSARRWIQGEGGQRQGEGGLGRPRAHPLGEDLEVVRRRARALGHARDRRRLGRIAGVRRRPDDPLRQHAAPLPAERGHEDGDRSRGIGH